MATANPFDDPRAFDPIIIAGQPAGGWVDKVDVKLSQKFDVQSAPGSNGAWVIWKGYTAAPVTISMKMGGRTHGPKQWAQYESLLPLIRPVAGNGKPQPVNCSHPLLELHKLRALYVTDISAPQNNDGVWS